MIKFGTSGFRAIMGDQFTKENVKKIAYGICKYAEENGIENGKIVVGFDNRFMSEMYAKWLIEVLSCKFHIKFFIDSVPSPLISFESKTADFGVMITSSHNPYFYNGIKIFERGGFECTDNITSQIANHANNINENEIETIDYIEALEKGVVEKTTDIDPYINSILSQVNEDLISNSKIKVLINCMHGSSYQSLNKIINRLNLKKAEFINFDIDPYFEYSTPAPYVHRLEKQAEKVVNEHYDIGFALDGDGDRFSLIDSNGKVYDCTAVAPVIYAFALENKNISGGFVKNYAFSNLAKKIANAHNEQCYEAKVGFKCIGEILKEGNSYMGAESNGISLATHVSSKDGVLACALIIEAIIISKCSFGELLEDIQTRYNFKSSCIEREYPISSEKKAEIINAISNKNPLPSFENLNIVDIFNQEGLKLIFENDTWCMIRLSGTEPAVRTFAEMPTLEQAEEVLDILESFYNLKL